MTTAELILQELRKRADVVQAENSRRFFKTGKGEYGEVLAVGSTVTVHSPRCPLEGRVTFSLELSCLK